MDATAASAKVTELPETKSPVVAAIEAAYATQAWQGESWRVTPNSVADDCERRGWYAFRWSHAAETFDGKRLRRFDTGHREEARLVADLARAGITVSAIDPTSGKQWEILAVDGHLRGKADGKALNVPGAEQTEHVLECKAVNEKRFNALRKHGIEKAEPKHWLVAQLYMHGLGLTRCLYVATNTNDDDLHAERIKYDADAALKLIAKAERIIRAHQAPPKLHEDPEAKMAWACRSCPALGVCHQGNFARRNCRTCLFATPVVDGQWHCDRFHKSLTIEEQRQGCAAHLFLPALVPYEQIDAVTVDGTIATVVYRKPDGGEWRDGAAG